MTATKVLGFYMESSARHKDLLRMVSVSIIDIFLGIATALVLPAVCSLSTGFLRVYGKRVDSGFFVFGVIRFLGVYTYRVRK